MDLKIFSFFGCTTTLFLLCCSSTPIDGAWQDPRPLGREIPVYRPPQNPTLAEKPSADSQEPTGVLTLDQALALALARNKELISCSLEVRSQEAETLQVGLSPNPDLSVEVEDFGGSAERRGFKTAATTFGISQLIETGGKRTRRVKEASLRTDLSGWDFESKRLDLITETTRCFIAVLAAQEKLTVAEEGVRLAQQAYETIGEQVEKGDLPPSEKYNVEIDSSMAELEKEKAIRNLKVARKRLATMWNDANPSFDKVEEGRLDRIQSPPTQEELKPFIEQNPDLARWKTEIAQRKAELSLERANRVPDLTLGGGIRRYNDTDDGVMVLSVSVPISLWDKNQGAIGRAQFQLDKAEIEQERERTRLLANLEEAYQALSASYLEGMTLRDKVLPAARLSLENSREEFRRGKTDILSVLNAEKTLLGAKGQLIEALCFYRQNLAEMERIVGQSLTRQSPASPPGKGEGVREK